MRDACAYSGRNNRALPGHSRGYATVMVIMVTAVLFLLGTAALTLATQHRQMAIRHYHQTQAYYIAEAGVQTVLADRVWLGTLQVVSDYKNRQDEYNDSNAGYYPDPADDDQIHNFDGGTFIVKVARKQDYWTCDNNNKWICYKVFRIYSTGTCSGNTRVLVVTVRIPPDGGRIERITWQEKYPPF